MFHKRNLWLTRIMVFTLILGLNLGALDGIINGIITGLNKTGLVTANLKAETVKAAHADPGSGSFDQSPFDPNHDETSTLNFRFDYDHHTKVELYEGGTLSKTLKSDVFYNGTYDDEKDTTPDDVVNHFTWNGKQGGEPMDDGVYTVILTPLDEWAEYPLEANVRIKNYPHVPTHNITINRETGTISIHGQSDKKDKIIIYTNNDQEIATTYADSRGNWHYYNLPFAEGKIHTIYAYAENKWETRSKQPSKPNVFEIYQIRKGDTLGGIADFYYFGDNQSTAQRKGKIKSATGLVDEKLTTDQYLLIPNPTIQGLYSPYTDPASQPKAEEIINGILPDGSFGDPVNPVTGNYIATFTDFSMTTRGLPMELTRTYNSLREYQGPLGWGWDFTYNQKLVFFKDGTIGYQRGDGGLTYYIPDGKGGYKAPIGVYDTLIANGDKTYTITGKDKTKRHFDLTGQLLSITDKNNNKITLNYDSSDRLSSVQDPAGRRVSFTYDQRRRITKLIDPLNRETSYKYNEAGDLAAVTDPEGHTIQYFYTEKHWLTKSIDPKGLLIIDNTYDNLGRVILQKDGHGNTWSHNYDWANRINITKDRMGNETTVEFDPRNFRVNRKVVDNGDSETITYDENGNQIAILDRKGNRTQFEYDPRGNLKAVVNREGKWYQYTYDLNDNLTEFNDPQGRTTRMEYDDRSNITYITDALGNKSSFKYNTYGQVTEITGPTGAKTKLEYDSAGNIVKLTDPRGNSWESDYDATGQLTALTDAKGNTTRMSYDKTGKILNVISPLKKEINYQYDANGNPIKKTDANGNPTFFEYDKLDNLVKITDALGGETRLEYDANGNRTKVENAKDQAVEYKYDTLDRPVEIIDPLNKGRKISYDANGNIDSLTDAKGNQTRYEYDPMDQVTAVIDAMGQRTKLQYDELGNLISATDPKGAETRYEYDTLSRLTKVIDALGRQTTMAYDAAGRRTAVIDAKKRTFAYEYDPAGNLKAVTDPLGNTTKMEYDKNNNLEKITDALGQTTGFEYDPLNRLKATVDALGNRKNVEYDGNGNRVKVTDGEKNSTSFQYDKLNRLVKVIDALNKETEYKYDRIGNMVEVVDANQNSTKYEYNALGQMTKSMDALGKEKTYSYDANGNLTGKYDGNQHSTDLIYDQLNRLTEARYANGSKVSYRYDQQGNRTRMEDDYGTTYYQYDLLGQLLSVTNQDGKRVEYAYDETGQRTLVKYPDDREVKYSYDQLDRLTKVADWNNGQTNYTYDPIGRRTDTLLPNGVKTLYSYDQANRLLSLTNVNGAGKVLSDLGYTYDNAGNRTALTQQTDEGTKTSQYFYDPLYQLKKVISPDGSQTSYTYDPVGNRSEMVKEEGDKVERTKYSYNQANELTSLIKDGDDEATRFQYDGNGNLTARIQPGDRRTDYTFDMANRLAKVELHQGKWMEFLYNGDGDLISKISAMKAPGQGKENGKEHWDNGKGNDADWVPPGQAKKQNEQLINVLLDNGNGNGNDGNNGNGNGNDKDKDNNGKHNGESKSKKEKKEKKEKRNKEKWQKPDPNQPQLYEVTNYLLDEGDPSNQVLMTYDDYDQYKAAYAYGLERTEVQALDDTRPESQDPLYYLYDGLGSVMQMTRPNGEVRDHYRYDEFGVPAPGAKLSEDGRNVNHNSFGYTGELWEEDVDLLYLRSRYYMPETGRFMSRDSFSGYGSNPLSQNKYAYVENNPNNWVDPFGFEKNQPHILNIENFNSSSETINRNQAVFFIHGLSGDFDSLGKMVQNFADEGRGFEVQIVYQNIDGRYEPRIINEPIVEGVPLIHIDFPQKDAPIGWQTIWLQRAVDLVQKEYGTTNIDLVGHSMGGLVARNFAANYNYNVDKVVTIATPHKGSRLVGLLNPPKHRATDDLMPGSAFLNNLNSSESIARYNNKGISSVAIAGYRVDYDVTQLGKRIKIIYDDDGIVSKDNAFAFPGATQLYFEGTHTKIQHKQIVIDSVGRFLFGS